MPAKKKADEAAAKESTVACAWCGHDVEPGICPHCGHHTGGTLDAPEAEGDASASAASGASAEA